MCPSLRSPERGGLTALGVAALTRPFWDPPPGRGSGRSRPGLQALQERWHAVPPAPSRCLRPWTSRRGPPGPCFAQLSPLPLSTPHAAEEAARGPVANASVETTSNHMGRAAPGAGLGVQGGQPLMLSSDSLVPGSSRRGYSSPPRLWPPGRAGPGGSGGVSRGVPPGGGVWGAGFCPGGGPGKCPILSRLGELLNTQKNVHAGPPPGAPPGAPREGGLGGYPREGGLGAPQELEKILNMAPWGPKRGVREGSRPGPPGAPRGPPGAPRGPPWGPPWGTQFGALY